MKFLVCEKQVDEGCDYTIGCGMRFDFIDANTIKDAQEKTIWPDGRDEPCAAEGEMALCELFIVPAKYVQAIDVEKIAREVESERQTAEKKQKEDKERAELQRLKAKYNT